MWDKGLPNRQLMSQKKAKKIFSHTVEALKDEPLTTTDSGKYGSYDKYPTVNCFVHLILIRKM